MNRKSGEKIPVYRQVEDEIKQYIIRYRLKRHDRLPSESQLVKEYGASIGTIHKALNNLVTEKIIYRRHGQGTFVAPRSRKERILVVPSGSLSLHDDYTDFLMGALDEANRLDLPCEPAIVSREDFLNNLDDVKMIYPEVTGVIFFRGYDNMLKSAETLHRQQLPFLFYGADIQGRQPGDFSTFYHNEAKIAILLADFFKTCGFRRIAIILYQMSVLELRQKYLKSELNARDIYVESFNWPQLAPEQIKKLASEFDVFHCPINSLALEVLQFLKWDLGLQIPEDIKVTGVDNPPACKVIRPGLTTIDLCNNQNGRRCIRRFCELIAEKQKPFHLSGDLELVRRGSC